MKATQLEQMKEDYSYIMETKERTKEQINQGEEVCKQCRHFRSQIGIVPIR